MGTGEREGRRSSGGWGDEVVAGDPFAIEFGDERMEGGEDSTHAQPLSGEECDAQGAVESCAEEAQEMGEIGGAGVKVLVGEVGVPLDGVDGGKVDEARHGGKCTRTGGVKEVGD